jgi:hypothetical protein
MRTFTSILLILLIGSSLFMQTPLLCYAQEENQTITVTGQIISLKMTAFADNPWEELALKDDQGKIYVLIGKAVEKLQSAIGKIAKITGVTKAPMLVSGANTAVLEVSKFMIIPSQQLNTK